MNKPRTITGRKARLASGAVLIAAGAVGGAVLAGTMSSANAATPTTPSSSSSTTTTPHPNFPAHGTAAHEDAEKAVTGADATKAQAAAVKSVGSGTAGAVTTDFTGKGYEVTVTKPNGSTVEVHLDSTFTVMQHGGPRGGMPGGPGGGPQGGPQG